MYARDASFGDDLAKAYGIAWVEDLFAPADQDSRYTTDVEAFLGAQQEWMTNHLPKKGVIADTNSSGQVVLPPKAERVYGKPGKGDRAAMYLDREGKVQTVHYRLPEPKAAGNTGTTGPTGGNGSDGDHEDGALGKARPDVTRKGVEIIGDLRTDALHEALGRAPIEDDTLMALLILALAGRNVSIQSGAPDEVYGAARMERHATRLVSETGDLAFDRDSLRVAARAALIDTLSARQNRTDSGIVARLAGAAIGADNFFVNMATEEFLSCLSRPALERACTGTSVLPRPRARDTRTALIERFKDERFVHPAATFAPDSAEVAAWLAKTDEAVGDDAADACGEESDAEAGPSGSEEDREAAEAEEAYRVAAE